MLTSNSSYRINDVRLAQNREENDVLPERWKNPLKTSSSQYKALVRMHQLFSKI